MDIIKEAIAGTLESSDVLVKVLPSQDGSLTLHVQSEVIKQFGKQIRASVMQTLDALSVQAATVVVSDKGALDCIIRARVQAAVLRAAGAQEIDWSVL
ncbi:MAG TPA: citrate lyase acyl carrier protein [Acetobacteraceae bacterium]|nr:citrate lyase acyl carrier protein [Acetobacteraceae bacterium]